MEKREKQREAKEGKEEDHLYTALFAAGTALLMVCLRRAIMMCLVEQWRAWVFFTLNVVLWAILFTSIRSGPDGSPESSETSATENETKMARKQHGWSAEVQDYHESCNLDKLRSSKGEPEHVEVEADRPEPEPEPELPRLSKEELNERVEAFISMFRQHLASDAKNGSRRLFASAGSSTNAVRC